MMCNEYNILKECIYKYIKNFFNTLPINKSIKNANNILKLEYSKKEICTICVIFTVLNNTRNSLKYQKNLRITKLYKMKNYSASIGL